jgi:hypothetical protein
LRSARAVRRLVLGPAVVSAAVVDEPLAPIVELLPVEPEAVLELPVEPVVLELPVAAVPPPVLPAVPVLPVAAPAPVVGVPVLPIGVVCVLCWPAPVAGSFTAGFGGVACAKALPAMATAARPASSPFNWVDAVMVGCS